MKAIIKVGNWWFFSKGVIAMSLFPFIFVDKSYEEHSTFEKYNITLNHEEIHIRQQLEMLVLFFYLWYGIEYLLKLITYGKGAYMALSFEREAYMNDIDEGYLKTRKFWSFLKYL
jgi:hypothetical protein